MCSFSILQSHVNNMGGVSSTWYIYSPVGTCTQPSLSSRVCDGVWDGKANTCTIWDPTFTKDKCQIKSDYQWAAKVDQTQPPVTIKQTAAPTPAPTTNPSCACTGGSNCANKVCNSCVINSICTTAFATKEECTMFNNGAYWCK
ncbi:hypothetical protein DYB30_010426 [Aphanomyces astaci]|uniref:Uncharacterized protein n=1 Tax=Aphanomyces astaci TaxID=112090 RepID=A0A397E379_APHAT|nr:hypothetical protein DYB30_010426 [Aphanomyces astaci]RHZ33010.1 hypothetical protein DYB26_007301 [Aphanomyces astaci]